ncbi:psbP domain-containing protein 3, chloroplastic isoform X6 [Phoenix dactylifera]|uniref:PsbP domain-containing protein 3, chloroplastic isoform X6 n=1 Tax=Phoenix dactylifera TaxID=42345 RepID=A0A8B8J3M4_PHODC|nr:psbP domain-containing protein 3, chloroplastic isoform X6 [Phoenix dactylifera]
MASVVSLRTPAPPPPPPRHSAPPARAKVILRCRARPIPPSGHNALSDERTRFSFSERSGTKRREALLQIFLSAISFPFIADNASAETDWLLGAGEANGIKSITAFYPEGTSDSNVSVVITGLGPDFTRLESFGTVDAFAETLVSGLDRSWKRPPGLAAKLINSKAANGLYYIEYTLQFPGERCRHILSAIGMASNGWYNRLYTVTGQFMEDESEKYRSQIEKSVSSFRLI